ncbi:mitochondrial carrier domain-containing protein [Cantharellus anzutake]|uniref:mitochondrial carrier domain-containing protein n=1 Tax=Cantharellus anzutake TaxID=1750568 RepID=UPI0019060A65|nr:mitochondrial carrier domain-containing protein [Cantharellus anzutake]XP_038911881.1 mitochondrial carrier domain-containing protein [Cantharellus anzutake]KAF8319853.1 mitochondrial carrier domain-containing protein [Cantharellus anzutake]KAF8324885.1 mitochondrial carrier domain-containing protein [Cantharellus anzutake]
MSKEGTERAVRDSRVERRPSLLVELISGSVAGAAQVLVGQPLDTVKTRAQVASSPMDILIQTVRKEGFFALYKGTLSPLIGISGVNSLLFGAYGVSRKMISPFPDLSIAQTAVAGGMAGAVNSILAGPVELFKIRMQGQYGGADDKRLSRVARDLWKEWGFRKGIMRGFWVTVAREIPAYAGFYSGYEYTKRQFKFRYGENLPIWALLASGSCGGISYWLACYPLDVVKSRVQLAPKPPTGGLTYIARELGTVYHEGGIKGLYRGLTPSLIRTIPAAAVTFATFEITREYLQAHTSW